MFLTAEAVDKNCSGEVLSRQKQRQGVHFPSSVTSSSPFSPNPPLSKALGLNFCGFLRVTSGLLSQVSVSDFASSNFALEIMRLGKFRSRLCVNQEPLHVLDLRLVIACCCFLHG